MVIFFFNDTATTEIYTLSLHDALPILPPAAVGHFGDPDRPDRVGHRRALPGPHLDLARLGDDLLRRVRSEEHTSELQSRQYLVCRLLLEKKKHRVISADFISVISTCLS